MKLHLLLVTLIVALICGRAEADDTPTNTPTNTPTATQTPTPSCPAGSTPLTIELTTSTDDARINSVVVPDYATIDCGTVQETTTVAGAARYKSTHFYQNLTAMRFDCSGLPAGAVVTGAALRLWVSATFADNDSRNLTFRYYDGTNWPITCDDWALDATGTEANTTDVTTFGGDLDSYQTITLSNLGSISTTGYTGFRVWIDGGEPTATNWVTWNHADAASNHPLLEICYEVPTPTPTPTITQTPTVTSTPTLVIAGSLVIADSVTLTTVDKFHGWLHAGGKLYGVTASSPARLFRFNDLDDLSDYDYFAFDSDGAHNYGADLDYSATTGNLYALFARSGYIQVAEINPATLAWTDFVSDNTESSGGAGALAVDDTYLYVAATGSINARVAKYQLSDGAKIDAADVSNSLHCLVYDGADLYATASNATAYISKVDPSDLTSTTQSLGAGGPATDDCYADSTHVWVGMENVAKVLRVEKADITSIDTVTTQTYPSYGVARDVSYVWSLVGTAPGYMGRIDPVALTETLYDFDPADYDYPNEIAWDDENRAFITFFSSPSKVARIDLLTGEPTFTPTPTPAATSTPTATPTGPTHTPTPTVTPVGTLCSIRSQSGCTIPEGYIPRGLTAGGQARFQMFGAPQLTAASIGLLTPNNGDMVYNTTTNKLQVYINGAWRNMDDSAP